MIIGASGMLGQALMEEGQRRGLDIIGASLRHTPSEQILKALSLDVVINTVAITDTALCEADPEAAHDINARPVISWARECANRGIYFIHISSDQCQGPICNEYARTKRMAEVYALSNKQALVVRTNIIGFRGHGKPTYLEWVFDIIENDKPATLFTDHITSGIDIWHFSEILFDLIPDTPRGIINIGSRDAYTKAIFVRALAARMGKKLTRVQNGIGDYPKDFRLFVPGTMPGMSDIIDRVILERQKQCENSKLATVS